jgi:DNA-binding MarR family transcriptional regulator
MAATTWLTEDQQAAWRAVLQVSVVLLERLDAELQAAHGLSLSEYEVFVHLSAAPQRRLRMRELAERALVSRSRLTHTVDRLERRHLVTRERCETDRRGFFAVLTPEGMALLEAAAPTHVAGVRRYLIDRIPPDALPVVTGALDGCLDALAEDPRGTSDRPGTLETA